MVLEDFLAPSFFTSSHHISARHIRFRVDGSLHKAMDGKNLMLPASVQKVMPGRIMS